MLPEPLQILEYNTRLSDDLTAAIKVKFLSKEYYLVSDDRGNLLENGNVGEIVIERKCKVLQDTIQIISDKLFHIPPPYSVSSIGLKLPKGIILLRLFLKSNVYCLMKPGKIPEFYWSHLSPSTEWKKLEHTTQSVIADNTQLDHQIVAVFRKANEKYRLFFQGFNRHFKKDFLAPRWEVQQDDQSISAVLIGMDESKLKNSIRALINDLSYVILGKTYTISQSGNRITINRNDGSR